MAYGPSISCHFHGGVLFHETCDQLLSQQVEIKIKTLKNWGLGKSEHVYWTILDSMLHSWMDIVPSAYPIISHPSFDSQFILGLCWIEASGVSTFLNHHVCCLNPTWWLIPLSKWVIIPIISGLTLLIPFITGVITHLLSGMNHQVQNQMLSLHPRKVPRTVFSGVPDTGPVPLK